jgi:sphinganine-1-phosphate aldolase
MRVAAEIRAAVESIGDLILIGEPTFIVSFCSQTIDVFHVNDFMRGQSWRFNCLQLPPALHFCVTMPQTRVPGLGAQFATDLRQAVSYARSRAGKPAESGALYGLAGTVDGNARASELTLGYLEALYDA